MGKPPPRSTWRRPGSRLCLRGTTRALGRAPDGETGRGLLQLPHPVRSQRPGDRPAHDARLRQSEQAGRLVDHSWDREPARVLGRGQAARLGLLARIGSKLTGRARWRSSRSAKTKRSGALYMVTLWPRGTVRACIREDQSYQEGCVRAYMGGSRQPTFSSSGLEDYFVSSVTSTTESSSRPLSRAYPTSTWRRTASVRIGSTTMTRCSSTALGSTLRCGEKIDGHVFHDAPPPPTRSTPGPTSGDCGCRLLSPAYRIAWICRIARVSRIDHVPSSALCRDVRGDHMGRTRLRLRIGAQGGYESSRLNTRKIPRTAVPTPPGSMTTRSGSSSVGGFTLFQPLPGSTPTSPTASAGTRALVRAVYQPAPTCSRRPSREVSVPPQDTASRERR